ncbi:hypothetical protein ACFPIJ_47400 [Dactylosporangium cerinum]|uniref:Uncharacterized protein n=1 Tax=Dactylosporangium cerinum TaxID=1434730 RepID=A0ABV9W9N6_9ACTN
MNRELTAAIDTLYDTFAAVPRPTGIDACPGCFGADDARDLLRPVPLRSLPATALAHYAMHVGLTAGAADDFRHFLPRMLEVSVTDGFGGPEVGFVYPEVDAFVGRLRFTGWTTWDPAEQTAVREFLAAFWHDVLTTDPDWTFSADEVLCGIGNAEDDLTPYLATWAALLPATHPAAHLRQPLARQHVNAFWHGRAAQLAQVAAWLAGPPTVGNAP